LLAVDFSGEADFVAGRALALARTVGARLTLCHVVAPVYQEPIYEGVLARPLDLEAQLVEAATRNLQALATRLGVDPSDIVVEVGLPKAGILRAAREREADLIVVGSHGAHGLAVLLGSTANAVLHGAPCDVLAVRTPA
jgi:universal stress protein A